MNVTSYKSFSRKTVVQSQSFSSFSSISKKKSSNMCLTKDEMVSAIENNNSPVSIKIIGTHTTNVETGIKRTVKDFVELLTSQHNYPLECFKSTLVTCTDNRFSDKLVDFTVDNGKTLEDLGLTNYGIGTLFTVKLNHAKPIENGIHTDNTIKTIKKLDALTKLGEKRTSSTDSAKATEKKVILTKTVKSKLQTSSSVSKIVENGLESKNDVKMVEIESQNDTKIVENGVDKSLETQSVEKFDSCNLEKNNTLQSKKLVKKVSSKGNVVKSTEKNVSQALERESTLVDKEVSKDSKTESPVKKTISKVSKTGSPVKKAIAKESKMEIPVEKPLAKKLETDNLVDATLCKEFKTESHVDKTVSTEFKIESPVEKSALKEESESIVDKSVIKERNVEISDVKKDNSKQIETEKPSENTISEKLETEYSVEETENKREETVSSVSNNIVDEIVKNDEVTNKPKDNIVQPEDSSANSVEKDVKISTNTIVDTAAANKLDNASRVIESIVNATDNEASSPVDKDKPEFQLAGFSINPKRWCPDTQEDNHLYPITTPVEFVGLVNQAMTCYLNSLIQALFMTPEFRNAVYKWKYEGDTEGEKKSITYQLQKLFLNLQTSPRAAVETTGLTESFGWESSDAWHQHDIQELCRVMFDALETQFKESKSVTCDQGDLINNLYQGKMMDYVKCLECGTEKSREDTFLDIPLPVRPFGSTVAYGDIVEAMRAFVQPETLDGNNQYFCEKCSKKCDAHKGLKFTEFPYLLTLHLMRFDFDYNTMHRIKLNDKVTFPRTLNLNSFNASEGSLVFEKEKEEESEGFPEEIPAKCDDSSTTDSGSALEDESCHDHEQDDDEGIDISNPEAKDNTSNAKGPYIYDLFSIMIHSGSASGGHYYAYIKDFNTQQWYCFNDQSVSRITDEDISKTYGGGPARAYYSGAYSSSTNAYMLMYRQIDSERNTTAITKDQFPEHIKELHEKLQVREEEEKMRSQKEADMIKIQVYTKKSVDSVETANVKLHVAPDTTLRQVTELAFDMLKMKEVTSLDQCRLIKVNRMHDTYEPIENRDQDPIGSIFSDKHRVKSLAYEMVLEFKQPNETFKSCVPGNTKVNMFLIDVDSGNVQGPTSFWTNVKSTVLDLKSDIQKEFSMSADTPVFVALENPRCPPKFLDNNSSLLKHEFDYHKMDYFYGSSTPPKKVFVAFNKIDSDPEVEFEKSTMYNIIDRIANTIRLTVQLPDVDPDTLSKFKITQLKEYTNSTDAESGSNEEVSPPSMLPLLLSNDTNQSDQSTSEDSSLTDSERTLMGDDPEDVREDLMPTDTIQDLDLDSSNTSLGNSALTTTSPSVASTATSNATNRDVRVVLSSPSTNYSTNKAYSKYREKEKTSRNTPFEYFKVLDANFNANITIDRPQLMIEIDKRMTVAHLMQNLEPYVRVSHTNFCICTFDQHEIEQKATSTLENDTDGEVITVKLKRILQEGEYQAKIFRLVEDKDPQFLMELICSKGQTIGELKNELVEELNKKSTSDLQVERCRLREKIYKSAGKILLDNLVIGKEVIVFNSQEWFLQEIDKPEIKTDDNQTVLSTRHFHPDTETIDKAEEILLEDINLANIKTEISKLSGIPVEFLDTTLFKESSYYKHTSIVPGLAKHEWNVEPPDYLSDGKLIVYCDNRIERKAPSTDDTSSSDRSSTTRYLSKKKEKALKIVTTRDIPVTSPQPD